MWAAQHCPVEHARQANVGAIQRPPGDLIGAIVTDGTRVLGLGDIGPHAGLPVMEGKALLFKYLGGVDAVPICLATKNTEEIVRTVELLEIRSQAPDHPILLNVPETEYLKCLVLRAR